MKSDIFSLSEKTVLISGCSSGMGKEVSAYLAKECRMVYGLSRREVDIPGAFKHIKCDLDDYDAVNQLVKDLESRNVPISGLINFAGISLPDVANYKAIDRFNKTIKTNLSSTFNLCNLLEDTLSRQEGSSIVNVASICAHSGFPGNPSYVASKSALIGLTKALALDMAKLSIRVNSISPGYFPTEMTMVSFSDDKLRQARSSRTCFNRWGEVSEIIGPVVFLLSSASSYITGADIVVDGGWLAKGL